MVYLCNFDTDVCSLRLIFLYSDTVQEELFFVYLLAASISFRDKHNY
jgi:hypothetical protein